MGRLNGHHHPRQLSRCKRIQIQKGRERDLCEPAQKRGFGRTLLLPVIEPTLPPTPPRNNRWRGIDNAAEQPPHPPPRPTPTRRNTTRTPLPPPPLSNRT